MILNNIIKNKEEYLNYYNIENHIFNNVGPKINKRGYLIFEEFYLICMWKSSRPKKQYLKNSKEEIENISREAFLELDEKNKIKILCKLHGVQIPTASAILSAAFPKKYAIIDIRVLSVLNQLNLIKYKEQQYISLKLWVEYLDLLTKISNENNNLELREIDKILFGYSVKTQEYSNLYKK